MHLKRQKAWGFWWRCLQPCGGRLHRWPAASRSSHWIETGLSHRNGRESCHGLRFFTIHALRKREDDLVSRKGLSNGCVGLPNGEAAVLDGPGRLHVVDNFGHSRLEELLVVLEHKSHVVVHDNSDKVNQPAASPEHGREWPVVTAENNSLDW